MEFFTTGPEGRSRTGGRTGCRLLVGRVFFFRFFYHFLFFFPLFCVCRKYYMCVEYGRENHPGRDRILPDRMGWDRPWRLLMF